VFRGRTALHLLLPGDPDTVTGGYVYDRRIVATLRARGVSVRVVRLHESFPHPTAAALAHAAHCLEALPDGAVVVLDGLALGAMPAQVAAQAHRLAMLALVHHPLAREAGLSPRRASELAGSERAALAAMAGVVVTSAATATELARDYAVPAARIRVVEPGTDAAPLARPGAGPPALLCVATLTPRKGHDVLVAACERIRHLPWTLDCVGSLERDPDTAAAVHGQILTAGLQGRIRLLGEVPPEALSRHYARASALLLASRHEGYGMVLDEALAHGLPVIATRAGAIPQTLPEGAGWLVPVDDVAALASALERLLCDAGWREALRRGALAARERRRSWDRAGQEFAAAVAALLPS
jgi:glycosyltransferase involved in cell wall biosynthesis